ncbi:MAG: glycosyltransferase [Planctomycetota bacterium]|nr:glycosyltransferase [Planctomycetota bacterium]
MPLPSLSVVVLSFNRREALRRTLRELEALARQWRAWGSDFQLVVADNDSTDASPAMVAEEFPDAELLVLPHNLGVDGFNRGAERARHEFILICDDDSWPDPESLRAAAERAQSPGADGRAVGGVMLHRRHPRTNRHEWPGDDHALRGPQHLWPDMGCLNLVRRDAWMRVGGYEPGYFLYRNDTDLALKLLAAGYDVMFDPAWFGWHDSPFVARKSLRWLHLSTRNWLWMARRHARGAGLVRGAALGCLRAHMLARASLRGHAAVVRGMLQGITQRPPHLPEGLAPSPQHYERLIQLKMRLR